MSALVESGHAVKLSTRVQAGSLSELVRMATIAKLF